MFVLICIVIAIVVYCKRHNRMMDAIDEAAHRRRDDIERYDEQADYRYLPAFQPTFEHEIGPDFGDDDD